MAKRKVAPTEDTTSQAAKRTLKAVPVPAKKELSLLTLNLGSLSTVVTVEWYGHGVYQVRLGPGAIRTLAQNLEELDGPKEVHPGPVDATVDSQDVLKVLSSLLGLKDTKLFRWVTWHLKATIRFLTPERQVEDEDWEAVTEVAGEIPTSPGVESSEAGSMLDLPRAEEPQQVPTVEPKTPDAPPVSVEHRKPSVMRECASLGNAASPPLGVGEVDPPPPPSAKSAITPAVDRHLITRRTSPPAAAAAPKSSTTAQCCQPAPLLPQDR